MALLTSSAAVSAQEDPPDCTVPLGCETTTTEPATTTSAPTTSTTVTSTTTTFNRTTTTARSGATSTTTEATTTLPEGDPSNVLVPGDGTPGAESTTTTTEKPVTISNSGTSDVTLLLLVTVGLIALAGSVGALTWRYWLATQPGRVGSDADG